MKAWIARHVVVCLFLIVVVALVVPTALSFHFTAQPRFSRPSLASSSSSSSSTQLHWQSQVSRQTNGVEAVQELLETMELPSNKDKDDAEQALVFLFVSQYYAEEFPRIVQTAQKRFDDEHDSADVVFLALVGAGVIGGNQEYDDPFGPPAMSMLSGVLPSSARATGFCVDAAEDHDDNDDLAERLSKIIPTDATSHIVVCDLFADTEAMIQAIMTGSNNNDGNNKDDTSSAKAKETVIIGGLSCPAISSNRAPVLPSIALNGKALQKGSTIGVSLSGTMGLQAVVAQGCRPIGPTFTITSASGNLLRGLDGKSALEQLQRVGNGASDADKRLIQRQGGLLCGVTAKPKSTTSRAEKEDDRSQPQDFLIRQIMGLVNLPGKKNDKDNEDGQGTSTSGGAIAIGVRELREGDDFQFHVRDAEAAHDDVRVMVQRAKTERLFAGPETAGVPVAALQISCVARGRGLFGVPNADLKQVNQLMGLVLPVVSEEEEDEHVAVANNNNPVAGFFANGEIGPVGISGFDRSTATPGTHIHGFTTVIGLLCDFSKSNTKDDNASSEVPQEISSEEAWG
jgi:small ligand-binding sensory domain FIST